MRRRQHERSRSGRRRRRARSGRGAPRAPAGDRGGGARDLRRQGGIRLPPRRGGGRARLRGRGGRGRGRADRDAVPGRYRHRRLGAHDRRAPGGRRPERGHPLVALRCRVDRLRAEEHDGRPAARRRARARRALGARPAGRVEAEALRRSTCSACSRTRLRLRSTCCSGPAGRAPRSPAKAASRRWPAWRRGSRRTTATRRSSSSARSSACSPQTSTSLRGRRQEGARSRRSRRRRASASCPVTAARNSSLSIAKSRSGSSARTVAVRGTSRRSAISPKKSPGPSSRVVPSSSSTTALPLAMA